MSARRYKPYPAYKDSGVEWLGEIPAHWEIKRLWHLTPSRRRIMYGIVLPGPNVDDGVPIVKGGDVSPGRLRLDCLNRTTHEIEAGYVRSRLQGGDLVYAIRGSIGEVALVPGELTGANLTQDAARVAYTSATYGPWLLYALKSRAVFAQLEADALGATIRGINIRDLKRASLAVPSSVEQRAIAAFLDRETARIDALVAKKERLIELLQEQRTALITRAVTKGLDPTVPMKDSCVEWLGEIPAHWEVKRLKHVSSVENSGAYGAEPGEGAVDLAVCTTAHLTMDGRFLVDEMPVRGFSVLEAARYVGAPGDIFVVKSSGSNTNIISGKLGLVTETTPKVVFSNFLLRIRPSGKSVFPEFLAYLLRSELTRERIQRMVATTTYPNIDVPEYVGSALAIPPIDEQERIAAALNRETSRFDALNDEVSDAIDRLKELRTALISAAVTGKIDVREEAA